MLKILPAYQTSESVIVRSRNPDILKVNSIKNSKYELVTRDVA